jgi:CheY-like chemotaxis protein
VLADPTQLQQVLVNLAVNARDAMPEGGHLWMSTRRRSVDRKAAARLGLEGPGEYVEFTVRDDGLGMDEETASRVFDPFFTTKELGKGTGLGLATVYGILRESKGAISVESQLGRGSTFRALFPRSDEEVSTGPAVDVDDAGQLSGIVLLVEDEPAVRRLLRRFLAERGYDVLEAANGGDALCVSAVHRGVIDAVVTDVVMPQMGGRELALRLREERPEVPVLFVSGYSDDDTELANSRFLRKPFSQEELLGALRAVIGGVDSAA